MATRVIAFDVNETLLDLRPLDPVFEALFGDTSVRPQWFAQMLQVAFVGAITYRYVDFTTSRVHSTWWRSAEASPWRRTRPVEWRRRCTRCCRAAFVARPGMPRNPIDPQPDLVGADLGEIADRILAA